MAGETPRVLRISFEFHIPKGLRANVQNKRITAAVERLTQAVQTLAPVVMPWADRLDVQWDWSYRWNGDWEEIELPETDQNIPMVE